MRLYNCWSSLTGSAAGPRTSIVKESSDASLGLQHEMLHPRGRFFLLKEIVPKAAKSLGPTLSSSDRHDRRPPHQRFSNDTQFRVR
jgi:hypothetical protein